MRKPSKTRVKNSLIEQLTQMGANIPFFEDLVEDYMCLWDVKNGLQKDIKERGVTYIDVSSVGVEMMKNNPSTKELTMVNRQMLSILEKLGLSTDKCKFEDDDEL